MYKHIYVPLDNSEHSNSAIGVSLALAKAFGSKITGSHVYAAKMHDKRFKQMEYTLPEEYRDESELEKQRKIHDTLITMGLKLISDSYIEVLKCRAEEEKIPFEAKMFDGKHFEVLVSDIQSSDYDLVVIGALGTGAVKESVLGSVCERTVRRIRTDTYVVKDVRPQSEQNGPILVAIGGSPFSYGGLKTAIQLSKALNRPLEAVGVYDPYLHYVVFNGIVNVLTEKASKVFKFNEQEKLHEEIIDTGLAKIYQSHLEVAQGIAKEEGVDLKINLLDGKVFEKILKLSKKINASMVVFGRIGYHSPDESMDVGSNTENLLRLLPCDVLISSRKHVPSIDLKANAAIEWSTEAESRMKNVPEFVRGIARIAVLRYAFEHGHSIVTNSVIDKVMEIFMPQRSENAVNRLAESLAMQSVETGGVTYICSVCGHSVKETLPPLCVVCNADSGKFEKMDRTVIEAMIKGGSEGKTETENTFDGVALQWTEETSKLMLKLPAGRARRVAKARIEKKTKVRGLNVVTMEVALPIIQEIAEDEEIAFAPPLLEKEREGVRILDSQDPSSALQAPSPLQGEGNGMDSGLKWTDEAVARLGRVPKGFMRDNSKIKIEEYARKIEAETITLDVAEGGLAEARKMMEEMITGYAQNPAPFRG